MNAAAGSRQPAAGAPPLVDVEHLTKIFQPLQLRLRSLRPVHRQPPVRALDDVTLSVHREEVLGLLGTNGAGKTTLLKIVGSLILPTAGRVRIAGQDVVTDGDRVKHSIGLVISEERSFYWRLTGQQNLEFFSAFQNLSARAARARIRHLRDQLGLEALERPFGLYSTGMRHRLAIARALLHEPSLLLFDEPTRSLDPLAAANLHRLIREQLVANRRVTAVLATHDLHEAETVCDRIAILHHGRLVGCGTLAALRRQSGLPAPRQDICADTARQAGDHAVTLAAIFERLTTQASPHV